jgi:hypothetical protein
MPYSEYPTPAPTALFWPGAAGKEHSMPSSKDRRRIEVPTPLYERLKQIAEVEDRTIASVLFEVVSLGLANYTPQLVPRMHMDRFDDAAQRALAFAKDEALALNHNYIGTEHILLGLLREPVGIAAEVLRRLWIEIEKVRAAVVHVIGVGKEAVNGEIGYTPRVRKVFALAIEEAQRLGHDHVGTEHLLIGLVREGEGIAAGVLQTYGALERAHEYTLEAIARHAIGSAAADAPARRADAPSAPQEEDGAARSTEDTQR